jgi:hypothetical protein
MLPGEVIWRIAMTLIGRIGQFIFFLGFLGLVIFIATDQAEMPKYAFLCVGVPMLFGGAYLMWTHRNPPEPSQRFSSLRKMSEDRQKKRETIEEQKFSNAEKQSKKS